MVKTLLVGSMFYVKMGYTYRSLLSTRFVRRHGFPSGCATVGAWRKNKTRSIQRLSKMHGIGFDSFTNISQYTRYTRDPRHAGCPNFDGIVPLTLPRTRNLAFQPCRVRRDDDTPLRHRMHSWFTIHSVRQVTGIAYCFLRVVKQTAAPLSCA